MKYIVYGQRYNKYEPIVDSKTKEVIDNGEPKRVQLSEWGDEKTAENFMENVKNSVAKRSWKLWVEQKS